MPRTTILRWVFTVVCAMALIGGYALVTSAEAPSTYAPVTHQASSPVLGRPRPEATRGSSTIAPASPARASSDYVTKVVYASADTFIAPGEGEPRGDLPYIEVGGGRVGLLKFDLNGVIPPGAEVTNAYLALYLSDYTAACEVPSGCQVAWFYVHALDSLWTEDSVWPVEVGQDVIGSFNVDIPPWEQWTGCDVTFQTRQWLSGQTPNHGLWVETDADGGFRFLSRQNCPEHTPHLAIRYQDEEPLETLLFMPVMMDLRHTPSTNLVETPRTPN